jgi:hypothetical protein
MLPCRREFGCRDLVRTSGVLAVFCRAENPVHFRVARLANCPAVRSAGAAAGSVRNPRNPARRRIGCCFSGAGRTAWHPMVASVSCPHCFESMAAGEPGRAYTCPHCRGRVLMGDMEMIPAPARPLPARLPEPPPPPFVPQPQVQPIVVHTAPAPQPRLEADCRDATGFLVETQPPPFAPCNTCAHTTKALTVCPFVV